jgi:hypothetical protein
LNSTYASFPTNGGYTLSTAEVGNDLLGGGSGLNLNFAAQSNFDVTEFDFSGVDQVTLNIGNSYAFEIWNLDQTGNVFLQRLTSQSYLGGEVLFSNSGNGDDQEPFSPEPRGHVAGGPRNLLFAVYPAVPEPGAGSLLGVGVIGLLGRRSRNERARNYQWR